MVAQWEWAILLLVVLALLIAELISTRRSIRRAGDAPPGAPSPPAPGNAER